MAQAKRRHRTQSPSPKGRARRRRPQPIEPTPSLDDLVGRLREIEALAHAAAQALQGLPRTPDPAARLAAGRLFTLVMLTAETASAVLALTIRGCDEPCADLPSARSADIE